MITRYFRRIIALRLIAVVAIHPIVGASISFLPAGQARLPFTKEVDASASNPIIRTLSILRGGHSSDMNIAGEEANDDTAWEEEIRRTREYYNAPGPGTNRSPSSKADDGGAMEESDGASKEDAPPNANDGEIDDELVATEDERVFGNDQTARSYDLPRGEEDEEDAMAMEFATAQLAEEMEEDGVEEIQTMHSEEVESSVENEEVDLEESADVYGQEDENIILATENIETDETQIPGEEKEKEEEGDDQVKEARSKSTSSGDAEAEIKHVEAADEESGDGEVIDSAAVDHVKDAEAKDSAADDDIEDAEEAGSVTDGEAMEKLKSFAANIKDSHVDGLVAAAAGQASSSSPIAHIETEDEDLLGWPRRLHKTTEAASNKLVEEGLRRLQRRDGDEPSVPYVITRAMKRVLINELGYDPSEVQAMRPDVAVVIVAEGLERPELDTLPMRFYNDVEPSVEIEESEEETSLRGNVVSLIQRLRKKVSMSLAGKDATSTIITIVSLGFTLSRLLRPPARDDNKSWGETLPTPERVPSSIEVPSSASVDSELSNIEEELDESGDSTISNEIPTKGTTPSNLGIDDLDRTWLDKLISYMSKSFGA